MGGVDLFWCGCDLKMFMFKSLMWVRSGRGSSLVEYIPPIPMQNTRVCVCKNQVV